MTYRATRCRGDMISCRQPVTIDITYNTTRYRSDALEYVPVCTKHVGPVIVSLLDADRIIESVTIRKARVTA